MEKVYALSSTYDYTRLRHDVFDLLSCLDTGKITKGARALIKPNLLTSAKPDQAVTTHPLIVKAAVEYALSKGAQVQVSDSNAMSSFERVMSTGGYKDAIGPLQITCKELKDWRKVESGARFNNLELASDVLDADVVINLPKLKTHCQMGLTLGVKNLFGCVVGMKKAEWHFRVGEDKALFAELLATIYKIIQPEITIMDGILAMEGEGPGTSGTPRHLGMLMGSNNALALDKAICTMLGKEPQWLLTNRAAMAMGLDVPFEVEGDLPKITDFQLPDVQDLMFGPQFARHFLRKHIASRPVNVIGLCKYCGKCAEICPAHAIEASGTMLTFDYDKCIRCYCCLEACPYGAMKKYHSPLKKIVATIIGESL